MEISCKIKVKDLHFFSHHGFYPEEQVLGNDYLVSIEVLLPLAKQMDDRLENTVNYELLYSIAQKEMRTPQKLLESVAQNILQAVHSTASSLEQIVVCITKINPPFGGDKAQSEVTLSWTRNP